jgi:hypothetical protein
MQDLLFQSLMEMEFIHRQEELEHAELERALNISLAMEEERLKSMILSDDDALVTPHKSTSASAQAKFASESKVTTKKFCIILNLFIIILTAIILTATTVRC